MARTQKPSLDSSDKPKRVFENMTIYKQYAEYHALKDSLYASLRLVNTLSKIVMAVGVTYLLYLTVSCFVKEVRQPLSAIISHWLIFQGDILSSKLDTDYEYWTVIIFKITAFMCAICFLLLGTFIAYYKSVVKVETMV